jgi:hypothetical protein
MSYKALQNKLLKKLDNCQAPNEKKLILKNYFNNLNNNFSYEQYKYVLDKNDYLLDKKKSLKTIFTELKESLNLDSDQELCVFNGVKKEEIKNNNRIKLISKNKELKKLRRDILIQKNECKKKNNKKKEDIKYWKIISIILLIITLFFIGFYTYNLD